MRAFASGSLAFAPTVASIGALLWGINLALIGGIFVGVLLALKMDANGYDTGIIGIVQAANFAGFFLGAVYAPRLINAVGHIRCFAAFATIQSAAFILHPIMDDWIIWAILRLVTGIAMAGLFTAVESWMNDRTPTNQRGTVLAVYIITTYLANMGGQLAVNIWDIQQFEPFIWASVLVSLSLIPVVMTRIPAPEIADVEPLSFSKLFASSPTGVAGTFAAGILFGCVSSLAVVYGQQIGLSIFQTTLFSAAFTVGGVLCLFPIGALADAIDRRYVMVGLLVAAVAASVSLIMQSTIGFPFWALLCLAAAFGGAQAAIYPISTAQAYDYLPPEKYTAASAGLIMAYSVGATLGPLIAAFMMRFGEYGLFLTTAVFCGALALFVSVRINVRDALPSEEQLSVTMTIPRTAEAVELMDMTDTAPDFDDYLDQEILSFDEED